MFFVRSINSGLIPYTAGEIKARRSIRGLSPVSAVERSEVGVAHHRVVDRYAERSNRQDNRRRLLYARDLMTSPVMTVSFDAPLRDALEIVTSRRFRHLLVVDREGKLAGILSDRDLFRSLSKCSDKDRGSWAAATVQTEMHHEVLTATPDTEIREIARVMFDERVGCMPIVEGNSQVAGIITRSDVLRALLVHAPLEMWG